MQKVAGWSAGTWQFYLVTGMCDHRLQGFKVEKELAAPGTSEPELGTRLFVTAEAS